MPGSRLWVGHSRQVARAPRHHLSELEKGCLYSWASEGMWTKARLKAAGYAVSDDLCEVCRLAPDTSHHRLFCCEGKQEIIDIRKNIFEEFDLQLLKEMGPSWIVARGLCRHPGDFIPPPPADGGGSTSGVRTPPKIAILCSGARFILMAVVRGMGSQRGQGLLGP